MQDTVEIRYRLPAPGYQLKNSEIPTAGRVIDIRGPVTGNW